MFQGRFSSKLPQAIQRSAAIKLEVINAATVLETLRVPPSNFLEELQGDRKGQHSTDTALRLSQFFGMEAQFWMNLQSRYDMEVTRDQLQDKIKKEVRPFSRAA